MIFQIVYLFTLVACKTPNYSSLPQAQVAIDSTAERMIVAQRVNGGWSQPNGNPFDYTKKLSQSQEDLFIRDKKKLDATIDDDATTKEIRYLATAFKRTQNPAYKSAAENGIKYLLLAQNTAGGWGQFYPDTSSYRKHITYNDHAMTNVMWIMKYLSDGTNDFEPFSTQFSMQAFQAMNKGIDCMLRTQYYQNGVLTVWCAQHDRRTLQPAKARAFELPSLSGQESVGIVRFLMSIKNPSPEIKKSIHAACAYFEKSKIPGINIKTIDDPSQPKGRDRVVYEDATSTLWARFYDLITNQPIFVGRDGVPKTTLRDVEVERRTGYAYYGIWPKNLLEKDYVEWKKLNP
jgi:PelA/Pel-15E family pectate lyase